MRLEPEMLFESIVREDRSLADLLDCNYTFLNARLAKLGGTQPKLESVPRRRAAAST